MLEFIVTVIAATAASCALSAAVAFSCMKRVDRFADETQKTLERFTLEILELLRKRP